MPGQAQTRALVVVDPQNEYLDGPLAIGYPPISDSLDRIAQTIHAAKQAAVPIVLVRHENPPQAAAFASGSPAAEFIPEVARLQTADWHLVTKHFASAFQGTGLAEWCHAQGITTVTLVGYMTNNCILATAADAAPHQLNAEVLSDATGSISLRNEQGAVPAQQLQESLLTLMHPTSPPSQRQPNGSPPWHPRRPYPRAT